MVGPDDLRGLFQPMFLRFYDSCAPSQVHLGTCRAELCSGVDSGTVRCVSVTIP